jgi:hypothetical protein
MVKKIKAQNPKPTGEAMSRDELMSGGRARQEPVAVSGLPKPVIMQTIPYQEWIDIQLGAMAKDERGDIIRDSSGSVIRDDTYSRAAIVAAVCPALSVEDAMEIQQGNGAMFAVLYSAVDDFLSFRVTEEQIKN